MQKTIFIVSVILLCSVFQAFGNEYEVTPVTCGDVRFYHYNLEKIIKVKNDRGVHIKSVLYYQDGTKIELYYRFGEQIKKTVLYGQTDEPAEIIFFDYTKKPRKAIFFSYKTRTKTVVVYSKDGNYKRVTESRL